MHSKMSYVIAHTFWRRSGICVYLLISSTLCLLVHVVFYGVVLYLLFTMEVPTYCNYLMISEHMDMDISYIRGQSSLFFSNHQWAPIERTTNMVQSQFLWSCSAERALLDILERWNKWIPSLIPSGHGGDLANISEDRRPPSWSTLFNNSSQVSHHFQNDIVGELVVDVEVTRYYWNGIA